MTTEADHGIGEAVAARIERRWVTLSIVIVGLLVGMATYIGIHQATMPQGHVETADPKTLHLSGEFVESNLGSALETDGSVTVRAIGQQ
jgi:cytochrome c oxidase subunit 2